MACVAVPKVAGNDALAVLDGAKEAVRRNCVTDYNFVNNDYFRMGAAIAIGELLDENLLVGQKGMTPQETALDLLRSYGVASMEDVHSLGVKGAYLMTLKWAFGQE